MSAVCISAATLWLAFAVYVSHLTRPAEPIARWRSELAAQVSPEMFGAVGDGKTDDAAAIQRTLDSGVPYIRFTGRTHLVSGSVVIRGKRRKLVGGSLVCQSTDVCIFFAPDSQENTIWNFRILVQ